VKSSARPLSPAETKQNYQKRKLDVDGDIQKVKKYLY
jgi:hypothetical protein